MPDPSDPRPSSPPTALGPRMAVGLELARALGGLALLPLRCIAYLASREALRRELRLDLEQEPEPVPRSPVPQDLGPPDLWTGARARPLRVFLSCAEISGELHALNLLAHLRSRLQELGAPPVELSGLGGERLRAQGLRALGDPLAHASMGLSSPLAHLPEYLRMLERCARHFREQRPDVVVLVDSPALHVPLGRIARRCGLPVVHFVTPQFWGWAPWRARGYRSAVDLALTILPFEPAWFERRRIATLHVGHPLLDELRDVPATTPPPSSRVLALLPGSRRGVIERNLPWMIAAAQRLRRRHAEVEVVLVHERAELEPMLREHLLAAGAADSIRLELGDLHASLARARAALAVSGTILLDLLHHRLPAVVLYRLRGRPGTWMYRHFLTTPYFASTNLLARREVLPEFCFARDSQELRARIDEALERCYASEEFRRDCAEGLELAARRLGPPGACGRAADAVLRLALARAPAPPGSPGARLGDGA